MSLKIEEFRLNPSQPLANRQKPNFMLHVTPTRFLLAEKNIDRDSLKAKITQIKDLHVLMIGLTISYIFYKIFDSLFFALNLFIAIYIIKYFFSLSFNNLYKENDMNPIARWFNNPNQPNRLGIPNQKPSFWQRIWSPFFPSDNRRIKLEILRKEISNLQERLGCLQQNVKSLRDYIEGTPQLMRICEKPFREFLRTHWVELKPIIIEESDLIGKKAKLELEILGQETLLANIQAFIRSYPIVEASFHQSLLANAGSENFQSGERKKLTYGFTENKTNTLSHQMLGQANASESSLSEVENSRFSFNNGNISQID